MKRLLFALLVLITISFTDAYSRAGGGGRGGGGGGFGGHGGFGGYHSYGGRGGRANLNGWYLLYIFSGIAAVVAAGAWFNSTAYVIPLKLKMLKAAGLLKKSASADPLWNEEFLKEFTRETFYRMQEAWMNRNIDLVEDLLTERLYRKYINRILYFIKRREVNYMSNIDLHTIRIVGVCDSRLNNSDRFVAYLKGSMSDVIITEGTDLTGEKLPVKEFEDLYYFTRYDNKWYLSNIISDFDFWTVSELKTEVE